MEAFVEWIIRPDPEIAASKVLSEAVQRLHRTLALAEESRVGVSFPQFAEGLVRRSLGLVLRLHGPASALESLARPAWLGPAHSYLVCPGVHALPDHVLGYRVVSRVQAKSGVERLRRRQMKRKGWSEEQALALLPDNIEERLTLPFVELRSSSTKHSFPMFICHGPLQPHAVPGSFNSYGLSHLATIPWF